MSEYKVIWEIELSAESGEDAARKALEVMQDKRSSALVFEVLKLAEFGVEVQPWKYCPERVDLGGQDEIHTQD